jgi:hypothetical protein
MVDALCDGCERDHAAVDREDDGPTSGHAKGLSHRLGQDHTAIMGYTNIEDLVHFVARKIK